jgi:hypothetical protein
MQKKSAKNGFSVPREEERGLVEAAGIDPASFEERQVVETAVLYSPLLYA